MGKNKLKRRLNTSSSSSNFGDVSLNIPEEQKFDSQKKYVLQQEVQKVLPAASETTSGLTGDIEKRKENEGDDIEGNHTSESVEDLRNFIYKSSDNLHSDYNSQKKSDCFESYFESLARRRCRSLENRPDQFLGKGNTNKLKRENVLTNVPPRKIQDQMSGTNAKDGERRQSLHPRKKIKVNLYKNPTFDKLHVFESYKPNIPVFANVAANEESVKRVIVSHKCFDEQSNDEKDVERSVKNQGDLFFQNVNDVKMVDMSNVNVMKEGEVISIDKSILIPNEVTRNVDETLIKQVTVPYEVTRNVNETLIKQVTEPNEVTRNVNETLIKQVTESNEVTRNVNETLIKQVTEPKNNSHSPPLTEEQKKRFKEVQSRTVFIEGHRDDLRNYFKHMPRKLNKEIIEKSRGQVDKLFVTQQGLLKIIAKDEAQRNQLLKIQSLNDKPVKASVPFYLTRSSVYNKKPDTVKKQEPEYFVKGVVFGLLENEENLNEIALELGAHHINRLGNPAFSKATLIAYPKGTVLPQFLEVDGRRYKVHLYIPKPLRCDRCQFFGHKTDSCNRDVVCSRCSRNHSFVNCPEKTNLKCANCAQAHSAAYKRCPVYVKIQSALKIRAEQNIPFADAVAKVDEMQNQIANNAGETNNVTYASKVKVGLGGQTEVGGASMDVQIPSDVQTTSNSETSPSDLVKKIISFDKKNYKAINTCKPVSDVVEDYDPITKIKMSFVLGVLATIDKAKSRKIAQFEICHAASEILFNKEIDFRYKDW